MDKLENMIEALLFLSGIPLSIKEIAEKLEVKVTDIKESIKILREKYSGKSGIHIITFNDKIQLSSNPDYAPIIEAVLNPIKERELSKAMMEVASIIAYKQPATRLEIEEVRGVNSDYALMTLCKHNIIEVVGRKDTIGKPLLYGTTDSFLKRFQLNSIDDLPDYNEILERVKVLSPQISKDLYFKNDEQDSKQQDIFTDNEKNIENINNQTENNETENNQTENNENNKNENNENIETANDKNIDTYNQTENTNNEEESEEELPDFLKNEKNLKVYK